MRRNRNSSTILGSPARRRSPISGPLVLLLVLLAIIVGALFLFASQASEVPTRAIETDVSGSGNAD
ncbi:MAG: hypothetical protein M3Q52_06010 [Pseudomonadota bacterium]|nr:hypothetical protein [Pseudomonadota bacterium]